MCNTLPYKVGNVSLDVCGSKEEAFKNYWVNSHFDNLESLIILSNQIATWVIKTSYNDIRSNLANGSHLPEVL
jgi:hypothetical protein